MAAAVASTPPTLNPSSSWLGDEAQKNITFSFLGISRKLQICWQPFPQPFPLHPIQATTFTLITSIPNLATHTNSPFPFKTKRWGRGREGVWHRHGHCQMCRRRSASWDMRRGGTETPSVTDGSIRLRRAMECNTMRWLGALLRASQA